MMTLNITALLSCLLNFPPAPAAAQSAAGTASSQTLTYTLRGEVRLLLFWVGRDNVGGGRIYLARGVESNSGQFWQEEEVLFGSNPERVPGKVNRWGYGKERSVWKPAPGGGQQLVQSVFEGFMRPTDDLPANMQDYRKKQEAEGSVLYKSVRSEVNDKEATTEDRFFTDKEDFDYRVPDALLRKYQQNLSSTAPQVRRELSRQAAKYESPAGFLTAIQSLIARVSDEAARNPGGWTGFRTAVRYVYNAKPYRLSVREVTVARNFKLLPTAPSGAAPENVAEVDFRVENLKEGFTYDFTLWFALSGPMRGLPLRIVHQPKWWLRLRLDITGWQVRDNEGRRQWALEPWVSGAILELSPARAAQNAPRMMLCRRFRAFIKADSIQGSVPLARDAPWALLCSACSAPDQDLCRAAA